jgi:hypothetical protein
MRSSVWIKPYERRAFIGGSDARIIMGSDEGALVRLWREKRGEAEPEDLSDNLRISLTTLLCSSAQQRRNSIAPGTNAIPVGE